VNDAFDSASIDLVGLSPDGSTVDLFLVQSGPWTGSEAQIGTLQAKIQNYVGFAVDGQLARQYPEVEGLPWRIVIDSQTGEPDEKAQAVFAHLARALPNYGGSLEVR
jgi:hypothetical protein